MKSIAGLLASAGVKAWMTTTTRIGAEEFAGYPVCLVQDRSDMQRARVRGDPILLVAGALLEQGKYAGIDPALIDAFPPRTDTVLLVEGDGSRRLPMKVPREREPVIPASTSAVVAFMGASAFNEPVDERHCYEHERALALLGRKTSLFGPRDVATLAAHSEGCRKGVLPGMVFRVFLNQGDLEPKREIAREALQLMKERELDAALGSFRKGELYATTSD